jgi:hypothetical protein
MSARIMVHDRPVPIDIDDEDLDERGLLRDGGRVRVPTMASDALPVDSTTALANIRAARQKLDEAQAEYEAWVAEQVARLGGRNTGGPVGAGSMPNHGGADGATVEVDEHVLRLALAAGLSAGGDEGRDVFALGRRATIAGDARTMGLDARAADARADAYDAYEQRLRDAHRTPPVSRERLALNASAARADRERAIDGLARDVLRAEAFAAGANAAPSPTLDERVAALADVRRAADAEHRARLEASHRT